MFAGFFLFLSFSILRGQAGASIFENGDSYQWKDLVTIENIIEKELSDTEAALTLPDLTDWSTAMLEAYQSLLNFTKLEMTQSNDHDMIAILDQAFYQMQNEPVQNPKSRAMVIDDMKAKQTELILKLTNQ